MKRFIIISGSLILALGACKKDIKKDESLFNNNGSTQSTDVSNVKSMNDLKVPAGFTWESSKDVTFSIGVNDTRFGESKHVVSIYTGDPSTGAAIIARGSASVSSAFEAKIYLPTAQKEVFVVKKAPDGSVNTQRIFVSGSRVSVQLGSSSITKLGKGTVAGPDCNSGCSSTVNNASGNLSYSSGTICLTGSFSIGNLTLDNSVVVRICGTGTINNLNFNSSSSNFIVTATGNVTFTSSTPIDGLFTNYGTITTQSNCNFNVNSVGVFTNEGICNFGKNFNPNGGSVVVNNGFIEVDYKLENSSGADFTNNCKLIIHDDFDNNGLFKNYGYIKCYEESTIQGGTNNEFKQYNGAMLSTKDIQVNGTITGFGTTSLIKVSAQSKGNSQGVVNGNQSYCDQNGIEGPWNATIASPATQTCATFIPTSACNPEGNGCSCTDIDNDGVCDVDDCYPNDATKAYCNYYPSANGWATVAFEDLWPSKGDYDLNDVVLGTRYNIVTNADNKVVQVNANYVLRASGGAFSNAFNVQFPVNKSLVSGINGATQENNPANDLVLNVFNDTRALQNFWNTVPGQPVSDSVTYSVSFSINSAGAPSLASFGLGVYNPFIWVNIPSEGRGYEIHLPGKPNTPLASTAVFGYADDNTSPADSRYYVSKDNGLPWAITVPVRFDYPSERNDITSAYLKFASWVTSGGTTYTDWYSNTSAGYRDQDKIYE